MTKEQRDKIFKVLVEEINRYAKERDRRIAKEEGNITGEIICSKDFLIFSIIQRVSHRKARNK